MSQSDMHLLFQQMGEVLSGIRGLHDTIDIRQAQAEQLHDLLRSDLATLRRDQHELEEKLDCVAFIAQHDTGGLKSISNENSVSIKALASSIESLRRPLVELTAIKSRATGIFFFIGAVGSCTLWLVEPLYRWFVESSLTRH